MNRSHGDPQIIQEGLEVERKCCSVVAIVVVAVVLVVVVVAAVTVADLGRGLMMMMVGLTLWAFFAHRTGNPGYSSVHSACATIRKQQGGAQGHTLGEVWGWAAWAG